LATLEEIEPLLRRGLCIHPSFESQGGPYASLDGEIWLDDRRLTLDAWAEVVPPAQRATAAAIYAGFVTARLVQYLHGIGPVVVDGPFAHNDVVM
jgi:hypothetical protein